MTRTPRSALVVLLGATLWTSLAISTTAWADGMRCGNRLVSDGDSTYDVRARCGAPDAEQRRTELRSVREYIDVPCPGRSDARCGQIVERYVSVTVDEWTYDFGPQQLLRHVFFEDGRLHKVETRGYGSKQP